MASSKDLMLNSLQHESKYKRAKKQEIKLNSVIEQLLNFLKTEYPKYKFIKKNTINIKDICKLGNKKFNQNFFQCEFNNSRLQPDGGIIYIKINNQELPILISERKRQGTIDILLREHGKIQKARGNAIERLGKNILGFQTYFKILDENIFPFVVFGDGYDFDNNSTIRDRVITMNHFGGLNKINVINTLGFQRGSCFFRYEEWTNSEIFNILKEVTNQSITYYLKKHGKS